MNINICMKTVTIENIVKNVDICDIVISLVTIMKLYGAFIEQTTNKCRTLFSVLYPYYVYSCTVRNF